MKSEATELSHISDIVSKFVIAYPKISFKLSSNGREIISSSGNGVLLDAISSIYGSSLSKHLIEINENKDTLTVFGYISKPGETKFNREYQIFFVNGRFVKNYILSKAFENAYDNLIPKDRHPMAFIFLYINPKEIDVNVHPTKKEIKFSKPNEIMNFLTRAVKEALADSSFAQLVSSPDIKQYPLKQQKWTIQMDRIWKDELIRPIEEDSTRRTGKWKYSENSENSNVFPDSFEQKDPAFKSLPLIPLSQIDNTYIVCIENKDLVLIDQHAAHERILYEKLKTREQKHKTSQYCLIPELIELNKKEFNIVEENLSLLNEMGFVIEIFGNNSIRVKAYPIEIKKLDTKALISDLSAQLKTGESKTTLEITKDKIMKLTACHGAIKAGDELTKEEINHLVRDLYSIANPSTCPHGRPSIIKLELSKIAKFFDRQI